VLATVSSGLRRVRYVWMAYHHQQRQLRDRSYMLGQSHVTNLRKRSAFKGEFLVSCGGVAVQSWRQYKLSLNKDGEHAITKS